MGLGVAVVYSVPRNRRVVGSNIPQAHGRPQESSQRGKYFKGEFEIHDTGTNKSAENKNGTADSVIF